MTRPAPADRGRRRRTVDPKLLLAAAAALPAVMLLAIATPAVWSPHWPAWQPVLLMVIVSPVLEEIIFRAGVHDFLKARLPYRLGPLTSANLVTALLFCVMHLWRHPPGWALATIVPALVFGWGYERHDRLTVPIGLHAFYNLAWLTLLSGG